jgi:hypothetical protein
MVITVSFVALLLIRTIMKSFHWSDNYSVLQIELMS